VIPGTKYTPEQLYAALLRYRWLMAAGLVVGGLFAFGASKMIPKKFRSTALILVVPQRVPENYIRSTVSARIEDRVKTVSQEIFGQTWLQRIIEDYDLYPEIRRSKKDGMQDAVRLMRDRDVKLEFLKGDLFSVSYSSHDPKLAHRVTDRLATDYVNQNVRDRVDVADATAELLDAELKEKKQQLEDSERRLEAYRRQYSGELPSQVESNQRMLQNSQVQAQGLTDAIGRDRDRRLALQRELADVLAAEANGVPVASGTAATANAGVDSLTTELALAESRLRELTLRYKDTHPDVAAARRKLREIEEKYTAEQRVAASRPADAPPPVVNTAGARAQQLRIRQLKTDLEGLDRQIASKEAEEQRIRDTIGDLQRRISVAPTRETELVQLSRDYETLRQMYVNLLTRKEDAHLAAKVENGQIGQQFKVLDAPRVPGSPYFPNVPLLVFVGAAGGLGLVMMLVVFREYNDSTLKSEEDVVAAIGLPVIAVIPVMTRTVALRPSRRLQKLLPWGRTATLLLILLA
jgi:polysaccharide chain length determinant protein (PEP-CTERM system associated)